VVDGAFGLLSQVGNVSADSTRIRANDAAFGSSGGAMTLDAAGEAPVQSPATVTELQLAGLVSDAKAYWTAELPVGDPRVAALDQVTIGIANLDGMIVGHTQGTVVLLDPAAAGYGWYLAGWLDGRVDLLTVVRHEFGHAIGLEHEDADAHAIMGDTITLLPPAGAGATQQSRCGGDTTSASSTNNAGTSGSIGSTTSSSIGSGGQDPITGPAGSTTIIPSLDTGTPNARGPPALDSSINAQDSTFPSPRRSLSLSTRSRART